MDRADAGGANLFPLRVLEHVRLHLQRLTRSARFQSPPPRPRALALALALPAMPRRVRPVR
eukprot:2331483-Rhodomonas_salina.1